MKTLQPKQFKDSTQSFAQSVCVEIILKLIFGLIQRRCKGDTGLNSVYLSNLTTHTCNKGAQHWDRDISNMTLSFFLSVCCTKSPVDYVWKILTEEQVTGNMLEIEAVKKKAIGYNPCSIWRMGLRKEMCAQATQFSLLSQHTAPSRATALCRSCRLPAFMTFNCTGLMKYTFHITLFERKYLQHRLRVR